MLPLAYELLRAGRPPLETLIQGCMNNTFVSSRGRFSCVGHTRNFSRIEAGTSDVVSELLVRYSDLECLVRRDVEHEVRQMLE